jgi:membrane dipeptidase
MQIDRRTLLAGGMAALASAPALAQRKPSRGNWYDSAIIIDALGGISDPYSPDDQLRLSDRAWSEMVGTGVTLLRDTVFPVGNVADPWGDYQKDITAKANILNANPDRLLQVRSAADILKAKREKKFAWLWGTQDSSMVSQAWQSHHRTDRGREIAARPGPRRRKDDGRGGGFRQAAAGY